MPSWRDRDSATQVRSPEHNESTARTRANAAADGQLTSFRCECGDPLCSSTIQLTLGEYESVRAYATHFAIARNHENPESEQLIEEHERFAVVEIVSRQGAKLVRRSYPRQWHGKRRRPSGRRVRGGGIDLLNVRWHQRNGENGAGGLT